MTYQRIDDTGTETGRRLEIEITSEMVSAGARLLALFDPEFSTLTEGVERLIRTALEAGGYSIMESGHRA